MPGDGTDGGRVQGVRGLTHDGAVTNRRARCAFCFAESAEFPVLTREHLVSRPVARAFGIDRTSPFLRIDRKLEDMRWTTVNGVSRKVVCAACNNGWMNLLEHQMSEVAQWMHGDAEQGLGGHRERILRAWMTKTHVLLCFIEGDAGRFGDRGFDRAVVPPVSLARALFERRYDDLAEFGLGLARSESETAFAYEFGTPGTVMVQGREQGAYTAPTSIITLGRLQAWAISPLIAFSPTVAFPPLLRASVPDVTPGDLRASPLLGNLEKVRVDYADSL